MSAVAVAIGGGAVIGAGLSYMGSRSQGRAAEQAADAQAAASMYATDKQWEMYQQGRKDLAPWRETGKAALADLERVQGTYEGAVMDPGQYTRSPGYDWLYQQGIGALDRSAAARGKLDSGQQSKDLIQYGQGLALQDYQGYLGRLESLMNRYAGTAQVGQTASSTLAGLGASAATGAGQAAMYGGDARANQYINQANARTGLYSNLANIGSNAANQFMLNNYLNQMGQQPVAQPTQQPLYGQSNLNAFSF